MTTSVESWICEVEAQGTAGRGRAPFCVRRNISARLEPVAGLGKLVYDACRSRRANRGENLGDEMAGRMQHSSETMDADFEEHLKTYHAFLRFLVICGVSTAVTLLLMYFFLAR